MASIPQRHTYYGGETPASYDGKPNMLLNGTQHRQRRKHVTFGPYILGSTLGEGEFGRVKLGWSKHSSNSTNEISKQVAIKLIRRDTIPKNSEKEIKIYREINALKHLSHPNIVKLEEVLQNSKYIGIVLEYASGGEFYKYIQKKRRLKEGVACRLFAQLISGVHYMHSKGLVHRDLKLENLLLDKHENLVITDFGFVNEFFAHSELMKTSCGSPCYAAPELVVSSKPYEARKADVWSCGIILYAMLAGYLPWDDDPKNPDGNDIAKLYHYITRTALKFPEYITPLPRDLLRRILYADPRKRISIRNIQKHEWIRPHLPFLSITPEEWDKTMLSNQVFRPPRMKSQHSTRPRSNCSTSSTGSKTEKRDSLVIDSALVNLPAPPQESQSHVITKPSPPSPELRRSPIKGINRHSRSNSAASIALQAVVDAEREHSFQHDSHTHPSKKNHQHNSRNSPAFIIKRSNTHLGTTCNTTSLMNKDSIIIETSPAKGGLSVNVVTQTTREANDGSVPPMLSTMNKNSQPSKLKATYDRQNTSSSASQYHNLAAEHRKPRPTSYHPGSSASVSDSQGTFATVVKVGESATQIAANIETSPFDSTPSLTAETVQFSPPTDHSPKMLARRSFSVSKPSLDLQSVSGDLIRSQGDGDTVTKRINKQVENADNRQRRQSRRYSGIVNEKVCSPVSEECEEISVILSESNDIEERAENGTRVARKTSEKLVVERKPDNRKRFSFLSFYSSYNTSKSSLETDDSKTLSPPSTSRKVSLNSTAGSKQVSSSRQPSADISELDESNTNRETASRRIRSGATPSRFNGAGSTVKNHRQSVMVSSLQNNSTPTAQPRQPGDQSTAKKVIDFFKRRSMRI